MKTCFVILALCMPALIDAAIQAEFKDLNLAQARKLGSEMLRNSRAPAGKAHLQVGFVGTDTDLLVEGIADGNNDKYVAFAKAGIKAIVGPWINSLLAGNVAFLAKDPGAGVVGVNAAARKTRDAFKQKLEEKIDGVLLVGMPVASANAALRSLKATKAAVNAEIIRVVNAWIETLPVQGGGANFFIDAAVKNDGLAGAPNGRTKAAFKTAIENLIKTF